MTTSLGIAATTAVIRALLQNAIPSAQLVGVLGNIDVSALPPDRIDLTAETSRLNLFMYQARPNPGWSNTDLPSHDSTGRRLTNPPLSLDLSYLLSAYGAKNFHGEILLGYGALVLHQTRVLTRDTVKTVFSGTLPPDLALLANSGLDGQEEIVSLSMESLSVDDMSRLWQVFGEKYRPSIAFQAHVLLLRGDDQAAASGPPVQRARLTLTTSINPTIGSVEPATITAAPNATIDLVGTGLLTADAVAQFSSGETAVPAAGSTPLRVSVDLAGHLARRREYGPDATAGPVRVGPASGPGIERGPVHPSPGVRSRRRQSGHHRRRAGPQRRGHLGHDHGQAGAGRRPPADRAIAAQ